MLATEPVEIQERETLARSFTIRQRSTPVSTVLLKSVRFIRMSQKPKKEDIREFQS